MTNKAKQVITEFLKAVQQTNTEKLGALLDQDVSGASQAIIVFPA